MTCENESYKVFALIQKTNPKYNENKQFGFLTGKKDEAVPASRLQDGSRLKNLNNNNNNNNNMNNILSVCKDENVVEVDMNHTDTILVDINDTHNLALDWKRYKVITFVIVNIKKFQSTFMLISGDTSNKHQNRLSYMKVLCGYNNNSGKFIFEDVKHNSTSAMGRIQFYFGVTYICFWMCPMWVIFLILHGISPLAGMNDCCYIRTKDNNYYMALATPFMFNYDILRFKDSLSPTLYSNTELYTLKISKNNHKISIDDLPFIQN